MKFLKYLCAFFFSTFNIINIYAQELSLKECIKIGLLNNHDILIAQNSNEIAANNFTLGNAGFLPNINLQATKTRSSNNSKLQFFNGTIREASGAKSEAFTAGATMNWILFDGFGMFINYQRLKNMNEIEKIKLKDAIQGTIYTIKSSYYQVVINKKLLNSIEQNIKIYQEIEKIISAKVSIGKASKFELMQTQLELNQQKSNLLKQKVALKNAKSSLSAALARESETDTSDSIWVSKKISKEDINLKNNLRLQIEEKNKINAYLQSKLTKSLFYPTISFNSTYNYLTARNEIGQLLSNQTYGLTYGISANWNIFHGFVQKTNFQNSKLLAKNEEINYRKTLLENNIKLNQAYEIYESNWEQFQLEQQNITIARELASYAVERYKIGNISFYELQDVQRSLLAASNRFENSMYGLKTSELELERLGGMILEE